MAQKEAASSAAERMTGRVKKPRRVTVGVILDDQLHQVWLDVTGAYEQARVQVEASRPRRIAELAAAGVPGDEAIARVNVEDAEALAGLRGDVDKALADLDEATEWFTFEAVGARRLRALAALHPPTDEQRAEQTARGGAELVWNPETFPQALAADSCVSHPGYDWAGVFGDPDELGEDGLPDRSAWSQSDVEALFAHAVNANQAIQIATHRPAPRFAG